MCVFEGVTGNRVGVGRFGVRSPMGVVIARKHDNRMFRPPPPPAKVIEQLQKADELAPNVLEGPGIDAGGKQEQNVQPGGGSKVVISNPLGADDAYDIFIAWRGSRSGGAVAATFASAKFSKAGNPDWVSNLDDSDWIEGDGPQFPPVLQPASWFGTAGKIHSGFANAARTALPQVARCLADIHERKKAANGGAAAPPSRIYVTGHSLGAAMATLTAAAVQLGGRFPSLLSADMRASWQGAFDAMKLVTYSSPLVGSSDFVLALEEALGVPRNRHFSPHDFIAPGSFYSALVHAGDRPAWFRILGENDPVTDAAGKEQAPDATGKRKTARAHGGLAVWVSPPRDTPLLSVSEKAKATAAKAITFAGEVLRAPLALLNKALGKVPEKVAMLYYNVQHETEFVGLHLKARLGVSSRSPLFPRIWMPKGVVSPVYSDGKPRSSLTLLADGYLTFGAYSHGMPPMKLPQAAVAAEPLHANFYWTTRSERGVASPSSYDPEGKAGGVQLRRALPPPLVEEGDKGALRNPQGLPQLPAPKDKDYNAGQGKGKGADGQLQVQVQLPKTVDGVWQMRPLMQAWYKKDGFKKPMSFTLDCAGDIPGYGNRVRISWRNGKASDNKFTEALVSAADNAVAICPPDKCKPEDDCACVYLEDVVKRSSNVRKYSKSRAVLRIKNAGEGEVALDPSTGRVGSIISRRDSHGNCVELGRKELATAPRKATSVELFRLAFAEVAEVCSARGSGPAGDKAGPKKADSLLQGSQSDDVNVGASKALAGKGGNKIADSSRNNVINPEGF